MLFVVLPEVNTCCHCVSLKQGTIFIAVYNLFVNMVSLAVNFNGGHGSSCFEGANNEKCPFYAVWKYLKYIELFASFSVFVVSGALIVGVILRNHKIVSVFMYVLTIMVVMELLIDTYIFWLADPLPHCGLQTKTRVVCIILEIISIISFFYMIIVVKSYRSTLIHLQNPRHRLRRAALSLIARGRHLRRSERKRDSTEIKNINRIIGSTSGASGSTSRHNDRVTPTDEKINNTEENNRNRTGSVNDNVNIADERSPKGERQ